MNVPHPAMKAIRPDLYEDLVASEFIRRPMPLHEEHSREARLNEKEVLSRRILDDMTSLENWRAVTEYAHIEITSERAHKGETSLKFTAPTRLPDWPEVNGRKNRGRIYTVPKAMRVFERENWEDFNRISAWVYPDMPGFRSVCLRVQLHNDGEHKVPDVFDRDGGHNVNLRNHAWNHITVEIPYVYRDQVIGVSFDYDMVGNEPLAATTACWYIDELELQCVVPEAYEGWDVDEGRIAYSHAGYQPGGVKTAILGKNGAAEFSVLDAKSGEIAFCGPIKTVKNDNGTFRVCDFSALKKPGLYILRAGDSTTKVFPIDHRVWMASVWKTLNFFYLERCGYDIPGKHLPCHRDYLVRHGEKAIVANGGWHDAADMSQQFPLTVEITHAMFELAMKVQKDDPLLYRRMLEEGRWGLEYLLKGRFGDGYRVMGTGTSIWTDGIFGTCDDLESKAKNHPYENMMAAAAQAMGWEALKEDDPGLAEYALRCSREDFAFARELIDKDAYPTSTDGGHSRMTSPCQLAATVSHTASLLFRATGDALYEREAVHFGEIVLACQQKEIPDWDIPVTGFFWREPEHRNIVHYNHRSHEQIMSLSLIELCRTFPGHERWMAWYGAIQQHGAYLRKIAAATAPFGMLPNSIYCTNEIQDRETFEKMHPIHVVDGGGTYEEQLQAVFKEYDDQLKNGIRLSDSYYLRRFPVWYSFRGNFACTLSLGKAASAEAIFLRDAALCDIAQQQFQWIIGKNPFTESVMYGEGHNYGQQYAVLPGEMVGELPVGMESFETHDTPFWPQVNNCTYKEVWVAAPAKWLWSMADAYLPANVSGPSWGADVLFTDEATGETYTAPGESGAFSIELPTGSYAVKRGDQSARIAVVSGGDYRLDESLARFDIDLRAEGDSVTISVSATGAGTCRLLLLGDNLKIEEPDRTVDLASGAPIIFRAAVEAPGKVWSAALLPGGRAQDAIGILA